jgi:hypothetical protein
MTPGRDIDAVCDPFIHEASARPRRRPSASWCGPGKRGARRPPELPRLCNVTCDFVFPGIPLANERLGLDEPPFVGESYASA